MKNIFVLIGIIILLSFGIWYYRQEMLNNRQKADLYQQNNHALINKIRKVYDEKILLEQQNKDLQASAEQDKNYFDWHRDISQSHVIRRLREN